MIHYKELGTGGLDTFCSLTLELSMHVSWLCAGRKTLRSFLPLLLFSLLLVSSAVWAAKGAISRAEFDSVANLITGGEFELAHSEIERLGKEAPQDPEYFVLSFNYYLYKAPLKPSIVQMLKSVGDSGAQNTVVLKGGEIQGFSLAECDPDTIERGLEMLREGLELYPDRLDMRFGLASTAESADRYEQMADALLAILERRKVNGSKWLWSFSLPLDEDPESLILENIQSRIYGLFQLASPSTDSLVMILSAALMQHYPKSVYGYSSLGSMYSMQGEYDSALPLLTEAYKIDSKDGIVVANLADLYQRMGDTSNAIKYYDRLNRVGTAEEKELARERLKELRK
jgi:tetratricopeptide (TPR) repeat protein